MEPGAAPEPKKKLILILAGFGIFLLIVMVVLVSINSSSKKSVATAPSPTTVEKNTVINNNEAGPVLITPTVSVGWKDYRNVLFGIKYPPTWKETDSLTNGTYLVLQPLVLRAGESGHVAVEINDSNRVSVASMSAGLKVLRFKKEAATVAGIQAQKFSGTINFPGKIIHNTAYLFGNLGKVYFIKLSYQQAEIDSVLEQDFVKIVSSFTFR